MKNLVTVLALAGLVAAACADADAACDFDIVRAKGIRTSMVRAYAACPSTNHPTANTQTDAHVDACTPVTPKAVDGGASLYTFGPKGGCDVQLTSKRVPDCGELTDSSGTALNIDPGPCHVVSVRVKCKDVLSTNGETPIDAGDTGFRLSTVSRATIADELGGDMTVVDFPVSFDFETPKKGKLKLRSTSAEALVPLVGIHGADIPDCASLELLSVVIRDPDGYPFATMGGATLP